ncbi:MAG: serine/threonine protein kinase [Actinomycetota bacterium]|nr:serine/threonine protein kinase [Actinomycetota bacterium]
MEPSATVFGVNASAPASPPVLSRYRPLRPLGSGGSGSVWLVHDERGGGEVALKIVRREGKAGARAEREAAAAARLRHPRCLRPLALDRDDGHVYVAYEFVRGKTLRDAMGRGELDDATAVEAGAQLLEALAHAHAKGVVHRDVKPSNVMLVADEGVSVRLLDFGLAHVEDGDTLTAAGDVPGTLTYIAPERLEGERAAAPADVWSVGVFLWEALAGWHPFSAPSPVETARRIAAGAPALARSRPDLPRELCACVDSMLALDPRRRPIAKRLPALLRASADVRARRARATTSPRALQQRALPALLAATFAGGTTFLLPFFPRGWPFFLGALAGLTALRAPRAALALALAVPVLPLGNVSLGLALAYLPLALAWLAVFARDARHGLLFVAGPLFTPFAGLGLVPAVVVGTRGMARRALQAGLAVLATVPVAGAASSSLAGVERPDVAAARVADFLAARPGLPLVALVFAAAAVAAPIARARGLWALSLWGSCFLTGCVLAPALLGYQAPIRPAAAALGAWGAVAVLALLPSADPGSGEA